jgi:hypothetical protein
MFAGAVAMCVAAASVAPVPALASTALGGQARRAVRFGVVPPAATAPVVAAQQQHSTQAGGMTAGAHGALADEEFHFRIPTLSYRLRDGSTASFPRLSYRAQTHGASRRCTARARRDRRELHARVQALFTDLETIHSVADLAWQRGYVRQLQLGYDRAAAFLRRRMSSLGVCGLEFHEQDLRKIFYFPVAFAPEDANAQPFFPDATVLGQRAFDTAYPHSLRNLLQENSLGKTDIYGHIGDTVTVGPVRAYCANPSDVTCWLVCPEPDRGNAFACRQTAGLSKVARAAVAAVAWDESDPPDVIVVTLQIAPGMRGVPGVHLGLIKFVHRSGDSFFADLIVHYPDPSLSEETSSRLLHEFGHVIGAEHSGALQCEKTVNRVPYPLPDIQVSASGAVGSFFGDLEDMGCSRQSYTYTYGDPYCAMGSRKLGHLSAINKERAGWLDDGETWVVAPGADDAIAIGNLEEPSALIKHVKVPIEYGYYYSLEYRTLSGLDSEQNCGTRVCPLIDKAVLVRVGLDPAIVGAVRISSFLPMQHDQGIVVREGESFTDAVRNLRIELVAGDRLGGTIRVTRANATAVQ